MEEKTSEQIEQEIRDLEAKQGQEGGDDADKDNSQDQGDGNAGDDKDKGEGADKGKEKDDAEGDDDFEFEDPFEEVKQPKEKKEDKAKEDEDDKDTLSEEDQKMIDDAAQAKIDAYKAEVEAKEKRNSDWDKYVSENAHLQKYSENIRPYMHKVYDTLVNTGINGVKVTQAKAFDVITAMILGKGMYKIGAAMEKAARDAAGKGSQNGNGQRREQSRNPGGIPDVTKMTDDEFRALEMQVDNGEFKPAA